jgi:hypothetical protein
VRAQGNAALAWALEHTPMVRGWPTGPLSDLQCAADTRLSYRPSRPHDNRWGWPRVVFAERPVQGRHIVPMDGRFGPGAGNHIRRLRRQCRTGSAESNSHYLRSKISLKSSPR